MTSAMRPQTEKLIKKLRQKYHDHKPVAVLFVCLGNICRSPAAQGVFESIVDEHHDRERWIIDSAATSSYNIGQLPDQRMRVHARRRGYELTHICRQVCAEDFENFDIIIGMDASNLRNLRNMAPTVEAEEKVVGMAEFFTSATKYDYVPDPYYEGAEGFELVLDLLEGACDSMWRCVITH